jgi:hypothetical protein
MPKEGKFSQQEAKNMSVQIESTRGAAVSACFWHTFARLRSRSGGPADAGIIYFYSIGSPIGLRNRRCHLHRASQRPLMLPSSGSKIQQADLLLRHCRALGQSFP